MARIETHPTQTQTIAQGSAGIPWRPVHEGYLRLLSIGHLAWALYEWAALIGLLPSLVDKVNLPRMGAAYFFAGLDPVAAVGLWFGSTWGAATWLVVTFARVIIHTGYAGIFGWNGVWTIAQVISLLTYLATFFLAERADREEKKRRRAR